MRRQEVGKEKTDASAVQQGGSENGLRYQQQFYLKTVLFCYVLSLGVH